MTNPLSPSRSRLTRSLVVLFAASLIAAVLSMIALPASAISTGSITGTVTNATGTGLPGITVTGFLGSNTSTATTNAQGNYTLSNLSPGAWEIDFADHTHKYAGTFQTGIGVDGGAAQAPTQKLQLGATLVGKILTSANKPLKGAHIYLWCSSDGKKSDMFPRDGFDNPARSFVTSKTGAFSINGEEAGLCTFQIGQAHTSEWYIRKQTLNASNTFTIKAGKTTNVGSVRLLPASALMTAFKALGHKKLSVTFKVTAAAKVTGTVTIDCFNFSHGFIEQMKTVTLKSGKASTTLAGLAAGNNDCYSSYSGSTTVANYFVEFKKVAVK